MWFFFALSAAVLWGLNYVLAEQIYKQVSVVTSLAVVCLITAVILFIYAYAAGSLKSDLLAVVSSKKLLWFFIIDILVFVAAEIFIGYSITNKNATFAGLIEISYPLFIVIFSYVFLKEVQLTISAAIGGLLIAIGTFVIYFFNH